METSCKKMINVKNIFELLIGSTYLKTKANNKPENIISLTNENKTIILHFPYQIYLN